MPMTAGSRPFPSLREDPRSKAARQTARQIRSHGGRGAFCLAFGSGFETIPRGEHFKTASCCLVPRLEFASPSGGKEGRPSTGW